MRMSIVMLFFAIGMPLASAADPPEWKEFASQEGRFKVLMPGTPEQDQSETESDFGKGVLHMNVAQADKAMYGANYCDFPAEIKNASLKQVYDSSRDGAVANMEGKLASEKDIKLGEIERHEHEHCLVPAHAGDRRQRSTRPQTTTPHSPSYTVAHATRGALEAPAPRRDQQRQREHEREQQHLPSATSSRRSETPGRAAV